MCRIGPCKATVAPPQGSRVTASTIFQTATSLVPTRISIPPSVAPSATSIGRVFLMETP